MAYYKQSNTVGAYSCDLIASSVGEITKDNYSVCIHYKLDVVTNEINYQATAVKNWVYNEIPKTGKVEGKKYREELFKGSYAECLEIINKIVESEGYWMRDPNDGFKEIFVEPLIDLKEPEHEYPQ
jgi:hypothetical protein